MSGKARKARAAALCSLGSSMAGSHGSSAETAWDAIVVVCKTRRARIQLRLVIVFPQVKTWCPFQRQLCEISKSHTLAAGRAHALPAAGRPHHSPVSRKKVPLRWVNFSSQLGPPLSLQVQAPPLSLQVLAPPLRPQVQAPPLRPAQWERGSPGGLANNLVHSQMGG